MTTSDTTPPAVPTPAPVRELTLSEKFIALLSAKFGTRIISPRVELGDAVINVGRGELLSVMKDLKEDFDLQFNFLVDITAVDWMDNRPERYEVVYHLLSLTSLNRLRVKCSVPENDATVDSITSLWSGANFMERETWDMYGVVFKGHPDLRRLLMYDEFKGHPLRKDYPVQGKQPRVPLRMPEVRNTAVDMARPALVTINKRVQH